MLKNDFITVEVFDNKIRKLGFIQKTFLKKRDLHSHKQILNEKEVKNIADKFVNKHVNKNYRFKTPNATFSNGTGCWRVTAIQVTHKGIEIKNRGWRVTIHDKSKVIFSFYNYSTTFNPTVDHDSVKVKKNEAILLVKKDLENIKKTINMIEAELVCIDQLPFSRKKGELTEANLVWWLTCKGITGKGISRKILYIVDANKGTILARHK